MTQLDVCSLVRLAELWVVNRDLKASDFSSMFWMDLLVPEAVESLLPLEELEDPEGPATAAWWDVKWGGKNNKEHDEDENEKKTRQRMREKEKGEEYNIY